MLQLYIENATTLSDYYYDDDDEEVVRISHFCWSAEMGLPALSWT